MSSRQVARRPWLPASTSTSTVSRSASGPPRSTRSRSCTVARVVVGWNQRSRNTRSGSSSASVVSAANPWRSPPCERGLDAIEQDLDAFRLGLRGARGRQHQQQSDQRAPHGRHGPTATPGGNGIGPAHRQHRQVVGDLRASGMCLHGLQHRGAKRLQVLPPMLVDDPLETRVVKGNARGVLGLGDAVAEEHEHVAGTERQRAGGVGRLVEHAQGDAAFREPFEAPRRPAEQRRVLARVDVSDMTGVRVVQADDHGDEARPRRMAAHLDVQAHGQLDRLEAFIDQHAEHRDGQCHQQRRRAALAGDIAQGEHDAPVGPPDQVVEIAADGVGRPRDAEGFDAGRRVDLARQHRLLNLAGHLEVLLQRQPVGDLQQDQQVQHQEAAGEPHRALRRLRAGTGRLNTNGISGTRTQAMPVNSWIRPTSAMATAMP